MTCYMHKPRIYRTAWAEEKVMSCVLPLNVVAGGDPGSRRRVRCPRGGIWGNKGHRRRWRKANGALQAMWEIVYWIISPYFAFFPHFLQFQALKISEKKRLRKKSTDENSMFFLNGWVLTSFGRLPLRAALPCGFTFFCLFWRPHACPFRWPWVDGNHKKGFPKILSPVPSPLGF